MSEPRLQCPACRADNPPQKFCGGCGTRLHSAWPACHHPNPPTQRFCGECGAPLAATETVAEPTPAVVETEALPSVFSGVAPAAYTPKHLAEKILGSRSAVEGERKLVTIMFTDVSGFTAMSERLDPEDIHSIMDRAFQVIIEAVHRYEGTINQFLGDGVMALFGAPIAHEDHPHRALRAALAIQDGLSPLKREIRETHGQKFRVRMGINTGLVFVGAIGRDLRMDYTAVGDTTNLAARLLGLAGPGQIFVSPQTRRLTEGFFNFEDHGEFAVKGKAEPVRVAEVKSEIRGRTRLEVSRERGLTPLVGRRAEIDRLRAAYERAASGAPTIVLLAGEPGVGKSRLLYEFLQGLEGQSFVELEASCPSHARSIPYYPILELVRRYLGLTEGTAGEEVRRRVAERLQSLGMEGDEPPILVAHFLGVSAPEQFLLRVSEAELKARTFSALRGMFLRASKAPVVMLIENVHWIDASSLEFLKHLAEGLTGHRVLLVLSTRPDFEAAWLTPPLAETILVEGLDASGVRHMIQVLLGVPEISEQLVTIVAEKGEGNPLYVEEILRQLRETGGILVEAGEARLRSAEVGVPATIHDIIAARIDRLAEAVKQTLQVAAVIGRQFGLPLLSRVLKTDGELAGHVRELQAGDFVFLASRDPEEVYSFKHALTQEVAYASLLERRRRVYHAGVGTGLEELYTGRTDEVVEILAHHFGRSKEDQKAVDYTILAAEKAQRRWANTEAVAQFEAALGRLATMPDTEPNRVRRIDAVVKQAEIKLALGRQTEHVQALEGIRDLVQASADPPRRVAWYFWAGFLHAMTGAQPEVPIAYCRRALEIADANGLEEIYAFTETVLTHVYSATGDLRDGLAAGEHALPILEARGNVWWICRTLWGLMAVANGLGEWGRSLEFCRRALEYGQEVNDLRLKVNGWWRTASTHVQRGDPEAGLRCCEEALALSPIPFDAAMVRAIKGYGLVKLGQVEAGIAELTTAMDWLNQSHLSTYQWLYGFWLAEGHLQAGDPSRARTLVEKILASVESSRSRRAEGLGERLLGESLMSEDPEAAARHLEAAIRILEEIDARNDLAKALAARGGLHRTTDDLASAERLLERALAIFQELGTLDEPLRVRSSLAVVRVAQAGRGLLVVSRDQLALFHQVARELAGNADVRVILDRRGAEPSGQASAAATEPRQGDRRQRSETDAELRSMGYAILPDDFAL